MTDGPVKTAIEGRVGVLSFNRPEVLNAFDAPLMEATGRALAGFVEDERVLAVVVRGEGRCFSAGFDMKEAAARTVATAEEWRRILTEDFEFVMQFWTCPKPTVAAAHGYCLGGAFELMLACDISVAGAGTRLGQPEVRFGSGVIAMLAPWVTGPKQAKELLLTGDDRVSAHRCLEMGVLNRVVDDGDELDAAMGIARQIAGSAARSVQLTKQAINRSYEAAGMRRALAEALEAEISIESDRSPERDEFDRIRREQGLKAAFAWRDARFT